MLFCKLLHKQSVAFRISFCYNAPMNSNWIGRKLNDLGYRLTPQRLMILNAIEEADNHISAEEIYDKVCARYPQMNISTV